MSQFSVLASLINSRLEEACESLDELKMRSDSPYKDQKVAILSDVHNKLCDAGETLHTAFTWVLTILIAVCFVGSTVLTFYIYTVQKRNGNFDIRLLLLQDEKGFRLEGACEILNELKMRSDSPYKDQKVAILSDVHNQLCDAGEILHNSLTCLLTVIIAVCFVGITVLTFHLYSAQERNENFDIRLLLFKDDKVLWIISFFTTIWKISASSSALTQKVFKLTNYIYKSGAT
ncbi:unnamed protein product [Nezara viridula]|uniref:Uncharacterized protein n=1 Tax=Nezara viridula TaxID=85310 RepID=A0A9P0H938_NEZVI|nr:unnamed protein product [Nezara viridula]